jgi:hypothetical protein
MITIITSSSVNCRPHSDFLTQAETTEIFIKIGNAIASYSGTNIQTKCKTVELKLKLFEHFPPCINPPLHFFRRQPKIKKDGNDQTERASQTKIPICKFVRNSIQEKKNLVCLLYEVIFLLDNLYIYIH